jgi:hypothetical protein
MAKQRTIPAAPKLAAMPSPASTLGGWRLHQHYIERMMAEVEEQERWKALWFARRDWWMRNVGPVRHYNADEGDLSNRWANTPMSSELIGLEQWAHRQATMYAAAAEALRGHLERQAR